MDTETEEPETDESSSSSASSSSSSVSTVSDSDSSEMEIVEDKDEELPVVISSDFVQFESSVGVHNDDLAAQLFNHAFEPPIAILIGEENKPILKHGIILEQSPFFRHVLKNMKTVDLTAFDSSAVQLLIKYLYTGKLIISKTNVRKLLVTAEKFELNDVKTKCIQVIQDSLDNTNSFNVRKFAKYCGIPSLLMSADAFLTKNLAGLTRSQLFLDLRSDDILELLNSCPKGSIPSATEFSAILAWVQHDETIRESHLPQLMRNLSLDDLIESTPELLEVPFGRDGILARNNECLFNYTEALKRNASKPKDSSGKQKQKRRRVQLETGTEEADSCSISEMDQQLEDQKGHPLFNDVILINLFEFMRGKDLKECRLVCKKWCVSTLPSCRSKFHIKLQGNSTEMTRHLTNFVQVFRENTLGIPFVKYNLDPFCTTEGPGQEFLQICGSTAKTVCLMPDHDVSTIEVEDIGEILKAMPNIEVFGISHHFINSRSGNVVKLFPDDSTKPTLNFLTSIFFHDMYPYKSIDFCPTFIDEILSVAPIVSQFRVLDSRVDPDRSRIGQVLKAIENCGRETIINDLQLFDASPEHFEQLRRLAENGLKLKRLDFVQRSGHGRSQVQVQDSNNFLPKLATLFKNSIERLNMDEVCQNFIQLPHMSTLQSLQLDIPEDFDSRRVNLKKLCPALEELELYYADSVVNGWELEELFPDSEPCPNIRNFSLSNVVMKIKPFRHILNIFPKLTKLELNVKGDGVQVLGGIMTQMTQLENLSLVGMINGIESIDSLLTGIPVLKVGELEHVVIELKEMSVQLRAENIRHYRDRYCQFPSIVNLTNLKSLHLSCTGRYDVPTRYTQMTDVFLYFGLYPMKHVNTLRIKNCLFTKTSCKILKTEMELENWNFMDANNCKIIPEVRPMYVCNWDF